MTEPKASDWKQLVTENTKLAFWVVKRVLGTSKLYDYDEWNAEAMSVLVRAAVNYDPNYRTPEGRSVKFCTYATWCIWNALIREKVKFNTRRKQAKTISIDHNNCHTLSELSYLDEEQKEREEEIADASHQLKGLFAKVKLQAVDRLMLDMKYQQKMTHKQIAQHFNVSGERVRQRLLRAHRQLKRAAGVEAC